MPDKEIEIYKEMGEIKGSLGEIKADMKHVRRSSEKMDDIDGKVKFHDWFCKVLICTFSLASMVMFLQGAKEVIAKVLVKVVK